MLLTAQFICTFCAALFAGAALYINVAEHPARMGLETSVAAKQWASSYKRATWLQAPLALAGFAAGVTAWFLGASTAWLAAALLIGAAVPFTLIAVMRTNNSCWLLAVTLLQRRRGHCSRRGPSSMLCALV